MPDNSFFSTGYHVPVGRPWAKGPWYALEIEASAEGHVSMPLHLGTNLVLGIEYLFRADRSTVSAGDYPIVVCYPDRPGSTAHDWGMLRVYGPGRWLVRDLECAFVAVPGFTVFGREDRARRNPS